MTESDLENACIAWFQELGYAYKLGFDIAPRGITPERKNFTEVILRQRLHDALIRLNDGLPPSAIEDAFERLARFSSGSLVDGNREMYHWICDGVPVEIEADGGKRGVLVQVVDWLDQANDWLVVNQFAVKGKMPVRPDMVVFLNGLPLSVIELKNPADITTDIRAAFRQVTNYQNEVPQLFEPSVVNVISDGVMARVGSITADFDRYAPWRVEGLDPKQHLELEILVRGLFRKETFLAYLRDFILFQQDSGKTFKITAGYHQMRGTLKAVQRAKDALHSADGLGGTVWFTQGSGKSFLAVFYVAMLQQAPEFENPTFVMVTDRNDLDGQLFETFDAAYDKLRTKPVPIDSHDNLRRKLGEQPAGGIFFTTIQKFKPKTPGQRLEPISTRRNLVVICDEAHRTQYGFKAVVDGKTGIIRYGLATHLRDAFPHAVFMGMTGTPISAAERDTQSVFGDYVDIYDVADSQKDQTTVPILYEPRIIDLAYNEQIDSDLDADLDALLDDDEDDSMHDRAVSRLTRLESVAMADNRLGRLAGDLVTHWEKRLDTLDGKGMIVAISRKAAVALYDAITELRPEWHDTDLNKGVIKIVMTSPASDPPELRAHALSAAQKKTLEKRLKDPDDPLKLVIVRDMWLTGFDAPSLHTLYVDKPMKGSGLMQAIARVNRVWRDKPGGLVVDYIGIGPELRKAIAEYANLAKTDEPPVDFIDNAVPVLLDTVDVLRGMYRGFDYSSFRQSPQAMLAILAPAMDHIVGFDPEDDGHGRNRGIKRYLDQATKLARLQALCGTHPEALALREEIAFFLVVRSMLVKATRTGSEASQIEREAAMRQLVSKAIVVGEVSDVYKSMGLDKPDISVLDERFLGDIAQSPQRNLAAELLQRLIGDEIKARGRRNVSQQAQFSAKLEEAIARYRARALTTVQVIEELLKLAHELNAAKPPEGMTEDEFAFYQALAQNESAVQIMGDPVLRALAHELTDKLRKSATVDWSKRESSRQRMRVLVKVLLGKYRYPPDKQPEAIDKVIEQAELFADEWAIDSE